MYVLPLPPQGIGVMCCEEVVVHPETGQLLTDSTWSYKIPMTDIIPQQFNVHFLEVRQLDVPVLKP